MTAGAGNAIAASLLPRSAAGAPHAIARFRESARKSLPALGRHYLTALILAIFCSNSASRAAENWLKISRSTNNLLSAFSLAIRSVIVPEGWTSTPPQGVSAQLELNVHRGEVPEGLEGMPDTRLCDVTVLRQIVGIV